MEADVQSALVGRAVRGDADALSTLLAHFGPRVESTLRVGRNWRPLLDAGDVMQITYLEAFLEIGRFLPDNAEAFEAWLRRIAENNLRDAIRGLKRQKQPPPARRIQPPLAGDDSFAGLYDALVATDSTPSRAVAQTDVVRLVEAALARLPEDYARAVRLYDLEGRPIAEIAAEMKRSPGAVHMLRARAHERLGELLASAATWFRTGA